MHIDDIHLIYDYNDWANRRIMAACGRVTAEQYAAPTTIGTGRGGLRATMVHILDAVRQWRYTCTGVYAALLTDAQYAATDLHEADFPTLAALEKCWQEEHEALRAYIRSLDEAGLNGVVRYVIPGGIVRERVVWHCLLQVVTHAVQHRSEAAVLLTDFGQSPGDLDFTLYLNERFNLPS